jgi:hypothetical protein
MNGKLLKRIKGLESEIEELRSNLEVEEVKERELTPIELRDNCTPHCPHCYTFGHTHKKSCKFKDKGMAHHVTRKTN